MYYEKNQNLNCIEFATYTRTGYTIILKKEVYKMSEFEEEEEMGSLSLLLSLVFFIIPLLIILICLVSFIVKSIKEDDN